MPSRIRALLMLLVLLGAVAACGAVTPATTQVFGDGQGRGGA